MSFISDNVNIINNIATSMLPIQKLVTGFAYVMGIAFAYKAIVSLKHHGESRSAMSGGNNNGAIKEAIVYMLVAGVFIFFPSALSMVLNTTFGAAGALGILSYSSADDTGLFVNYSLAGQALTTIIQTIGGIAFIRGWVLIARASGHGQQPGGTGKGLVHVFGGILAMNIVLTIEIVNNTLYGTS